MKPSLHNAKKTMIGFGRFHISKDNKKDVKFSESNKKAVKPPETNKHTETNTRDTAQSDKNNTNAPNQLDQLRITFDLAQTVFCRKMRDENQIRFISNVNAKMLLVDDQRLKTMNGSEDNIDNNYAGYLDEYDDENELACEKLNKLLI